MSLKPLLAAVAAILLASCATVTPAQKLDNFVDKTEEKSESYTSEDWQKSMDEYQALVDDLSSKELSDEDKKTAAEAMGRYHALLLKNGIEESAKYIQQLTTLLPEYLKGFSGALNENSDALKNTLESLLDTSELESSLNELGSALEGLFGGADEN